MNNLLRLSSIQALLPGLVMLAVPAGASAQSRMMGARMGGAGMARPAGSAAMAQPSRMSPAMAPAMQPMSGAGGRTSGMGSGSYGTGPYDTQAYGGTGESTDPQLYAAEAQAGPGEKGTRSLLTASGVPNDKGQLRWPIGLAILAAAGADELCDQIDALFEEAAKQAAGGPVNPAVTEEMQRAVKELRRLLLKEKAERFGMPLAVYRESERFLDKLDRAEQRLRTGMGTPAGPRPSTQGSSTPASAGFPN